MPGDHRYCPVCTHTAQEADTRCARCKALLPLHETRIRDGAWRVPILAPPKPEPSITWDDALAILDRIGPGKTPRRKPKGVIDSKTITD